MKLEHVADRLIAAGIAVLILASWEGAARLGWISTLIFPAPSRIIADFGVLWHQQFLEKVGSTMSRFAGGALLGGAPAIHD